MTDQRSGPSRLAALPLLLALFVISGAAGLVYQSVWSQYLGLVLGHAAFAQSLVLAIFMGGMSLGAWGSARYVERLANPLFAYALIEGAIGVFGLFFHGIFVASTDVLFARLIPGVESQLAVDTLRWTLAALLILPQTILLGATFPIMSVGLARWYPDLSGRVLGGLYFFNSIGAAAGALLSTFFLVPAAGLPGAMLVAGVGNILIATMVIGAKLPAQQVLASAPGAEIAASGTSRLYRFVLVAALVTGMSSFMYEIGWVRMLALALGSSVHAFELMLAAFIGGLAFGGLWTRKRLDHTADPLGLLAKVQILMGVCALATLPLYDRSFHWMGWLMGSIARTDAGYTLFNLASASIAMLIMSPAAFFAGMTLPIMTYVLLRRGVGERAVGHVYAANTLGAILGVFAATHVAIPLVGLKVSMITAALLDIALGLAVLHLYGSRRSARELLPLGAGLAAFLVLVVVASPFDPRRLASGVYRTGTARLNEGSRISFYRDGKTASIAMYGDETARTIATNGKPDAALGIGKNFTPTGDEPTMILAGLLGSLFRPDAKTAAVIGFGSGLTTHTLASHPGFESIDTIEIEPQMVEAARGFGDRVSRAFEDRRSHIIIDDARAYFSSRRATYDIIVSEPSNPWVSGVAKLFSREFYRFVRGHLAENGVMIQWVQAYEIDDLTFLTILRALDEEFVDYRLYLAGGGDTLIVASRSGPLPIPDGSSLSNPQVAELARIAGLESLADLGERVVADRNLVRAMIQTHAANPNSDYFPIVAHAAPRDRFARRGALQVLGAPSSTLGAYTLLGLLDPAAEDVSRDPQVFHPIVDSRRRARVLHAALTGQPYAAEPADAGVLMMASLTSTHGRDCFASLPPDLALNTLVDAFGTLTAALPLESSRALWQERSWIACRGELPDDVADLLATFAAAFEPDPRESYRTARAGLVASPVDSVAWYAHLRLALVAAIRQRDPAWLDETMGSALSGTLDSSSRNEIFTLANYGRILIRGQQASPGTPAP